MESPQPRDFNRFGGTPTPRATLGRMAKAAHSVATYADILALPDHLTGEILDGELVVQPRPAARHTLAASCLSFELGGPFHKGRGGPGGWWILFEPELHLGSHVMVPDLAGWRRERMPTFPAGPGFEVRPDWVCEILSPRTAVRDRTTKLRLYAKEQVAFVWIIDPEAQTLEVFRLADGGWMLVDVFAEEEVVRAPPFDAIELDLSGLWGPRMAESAP